MRNKIAANVSAFGNILNAFQRINSTLTIPIGKRYINTDEDGEKEWLLKCNIIESIRILPALCFAKVQFNEDLFIVILGSSVDEDKIDSDVAVLNNVNAGLLTALLSEMEVRFQQGFSALSFYNEILFQHSDASYRGHDASELLNYLEPITLYQIPKNSVLFGSNIYRIASYFTSKDGDNILLEYDTSVLNFFSDLSLMGSDKISYENFLGSMLSSTYKHSFLELYRLVERLFPINYLNALHTVVKTNLSFLEFAASLENTLGWKPKEEDAIEKLFDKTNSATKTALDLVIAGNPKYIGQLNHKFFYKLRNLIVHFRANHEEIGLTPNEWNQVVKVTLELIDQHYSENGRIL